MRSWDWKSWCFEADKQMRGRETKVTYITHRGRKFYRQGFLYGHGFPIQSPDGSVFMFRADDASRLYAQTHSRYAPEFIPFKTADGTIYELRVDNNGKPYTQTSEESTESTRQYLARDGQAYYLKLDNNARPFLETFTED